MKSFWSKNILIALLFVTNMATAAYIINDKVDIPSNVKAFTEGLKPLRAEAMTKANAPAKLAAQKRSALRPTSLLHGNNEIANCYEAFLLREPEVDEGHALFHWTLGPEGDIMTIDLVQSDFSDNEFTDCIQDRVTEMVFPNRHPAGTVIAHTFKFKRQDQAQMDF